MNLSTLESLSPELSSWLLGPLVSTLLVIWGITFVMRGVKERLYHRSLPGPPHSALLGSLPAMASILKDIPPDAAPNDFFVLLQRKHKLGKVYFMDNWPVNAERLMIITDPLLAAQVTVKHSLPKHPAYDRFIGHLVGRKSMISAAGATWKSMRSMFNPGFSSGHLMTLVPGIVDDCLVLCQVLEEHVRKDDLFLLEPVVTRFAVDVIGRVVLDVQLNSQTKENELLTTFTNQARWTPRANQINPLANLNPIRPFVYYYNTRKMDKYIENIIDKRYASRDGAKVQGHRKPAIDLALDEYATQQQEQGISGKVAGTDKAFKLAVIDQMKSFLFAGHDTTGSTIAYIFYMLSLHPAAYENVRKEHDQVFGDDTALAAELIKQDPSRLNKLPYTLAVIKETLRLYPIGSTSRAGDDETFVIDGDKSYPTKGHMVVVMSTTIHRRPDLFPSPDEFIPERFLPAPENSQEIPKDAWRPFERGPRGCIGQELAIIEAKIVMVLLLRTFDISSAFEEWDRNLGREKPGETLDGKRGMFGYRAYQTLVATSKPVEGMPSKVKRRSTP